MVGLTPKPMPTIREEDEGAEMVQTRHIKDITLFAQDKLG